MTGPIERRYRHLLRAYPAGYRAERGDELVDTYLATVGPHRRWPTVLDTVDVLGGALSERLRAQHARGLAAAVPVAATLALTTGAFLATLWLLWVELPWKPGEHEHGVGPFHSVAAIAWLGWIAAAVVHAARPGLVARLFGLGALVLTLAIWPVCAYLGATRPPLIVLLPPVVLGVLVLALPARPSVPARMGPLLAVVAIGVATVVLHPSAPFAGYFWYANDALPGTGVAVGLLSLAVATVYGLRRDPRGLWAAIIMLTPICALLAGPSARQVLAAPAPWWTSVVYVAAFLLLAVAAVPAAVAANAAYVRRRHPRDPSLGR